MAENVIVNYLPGIGEEEISCKVALAEQILHHHFASQKLILTAITHPSAIESGHVEYTYERLEFLGDSLVGAFVAEAIYRRYPLLDEGRMTRMKVSLVSGTSMAAVAGDLGIADAIIFGGSETGTGKRGLHSALENVYESLVAALFLDADLETARAWVEETLMPRLDEEHGVGVLNPKSTLQETLQAHHVSPEYRIIAMDGPPHDRTFTAEVFAEARLLGTGVGRSKKEAEQVAALAAIEMLKAPDAVHAAD